MLGDKIREERKRMGLTQTELAAKLRQRYGIKADRVTVSKWETGFQTPTIHAIKYLAEIFNVSIDYLNGVKAKPKSIFDYDNIMPIETHRIPLLGTVACGEPIFAEQDLESYIEVGANIKADFALRCKGDSMINARIWDGDVVFIRSQPMVNNGEIAAVIIDDDATLKRVYINNGALTLVAENPTYNPIIVNRNDCKNVKILGKAVSFYSEKVG